MPNVIDGIPVHILLIHAVVVLVPLAALCVVLSAAWPTARRRLGVVAPLIAAAAFGSVLLAMQAGEWLALRVPRTSLVERHIDAGRTLWPSVLAQLIMAIAIWLWFGPVGDRLARGARTRIDSLRKSRWMTMVIIVVALIVSAASVVAVFVAGEAGSRAV